MPNRFLIIDDDRDYLEILMMKLKSAGYKDITGIDAPLEAASRFDEGETFDIALIDVTMPEMDGIEAASLIWGKNPDAKIIFSSGYADPARLDELRRKGIKEVLRKPYKMNDLAEAIQNTMNISNHS